MVLIHKSFQIHGNLRDGKEELSQIKRVRKNSPGKGNSTPHSHTPTPVMAGRHSVMWARKAKERFGHAGPDKLILSIKVLVGNKTLSDGLIKRFQ